MGRLAQVRGSGLGRDSSGRSRRCQRRPGDREAAAVNPQPHAPSSALGGGAAASVFPQWDRAPRRTRARERGEGTRVGRGQGQGTHPSPRGSSERGRIAGCGVVAQLAWLLAEAPPLHTLGFLGLQRSFLLGSV